MRKLFTLTLFVVLFTVLCSATVSQLGSRIVEAASSTADTSEFEDGTFTIPNSYSLIRYTWINISGTQVINYVLYAPAGYVSPFVSLVGQFFKLADGTEVSVISALDKMEVYNDTNDDGIPEANFTSGQSEILYWAFINMSESYSISPIEKLTENNIPHYTWGFTYVNVSAFLMNATVNYDLVAKLTFDHITLGYDFSVQDNVSSLKTNFDIGKVTSIDVLDSSNLSLDGLSLALLFPTCTHTSKPYSTYIGGQQFNSTVSNETAVNLPLAQVVVGSTKAFDFVFGGNYTLMRGQTNKTYALKSEAASLSSVPTNIYGPVLWQESFFKDNLNLGDLFGGAPPDISVDYNDSSLIYRICFPTWDGMEVQNDPVYVGYLFSDQVVPEIPRLTILALLVMIVTSLVLALAKRRERTIALADAKSVKEGKFASENLT